MVYIKLTLIASSVKGTSFDTLVHKCVKSGATGKIRLLIDDINENLI